jgi:putative Mg2+ transporter-C (MgtC) family protein
MFKILAVYNIIDPISSLLGDWAEQITIGSIILRLLLSLIISGILGCERSSKRHSAGLRTFIVESLGATIAGLADIFIIEKFGVTFPVLSAGTIIAMATLSSNSVLFTSKNQIRGLTTAFTLWACGIVGLCLGFGFYTVALIGFLISLISLALLPAVEIYLKDRSNHFEIHLELVNKSNLPEFITTIRKLGLKIDDIEANSAYLNSGLSVYTIALTVESPELKKYKTHHEIIEAIKSVPYVSFIEELN